MEDEQRQLPAEGTLGKKWLGSDWVHHKPSFQNIHFPARKHRVIFTLDMISFIAAKRITTMSSPSITSTTTTSITATGEWRN
jgi:hypothetical protein